MGIFPQTWKGCNLPSFIVGLDHKIGSVNQVKTVAEGVKDLERRLAYEQKLKAISHRIHSAKNIDDVLIKIKDHILNLLDADRITIYAISDSNAGEIYSKVKTGGETKEIRVPLNKKSIAGYAGACLKMVNIKNAYNPSELSKIDPQLKFDSSWDSISGYTTKQVLAMPILFEGRLTGVIQLINKKDGNAFTEEDQHAVREIARVLGIAFYNQSRMLERQTKFSFLLLNNHISQKELDQAMAIAREHRTDVETVLMNQFKVSKQLMLESLSRFYNCKIFEFDSSDVDPDLIKGLSYGYLRRNLSVPIKRDDGRVIIVSRDPSDISKIHEIMLSVRAQTHESRVALKEDILRLLQYLHKPDSQMALATAKEIVGQLDGEAEVKEEDDEEDVGISESDSKVVQLANKIIDDAYRQGASDIHIEPYGKQRDTEIRFRVDGKCSRYLTVPKTHTKALISRLKIISSLDIAERRKPQDGRIKFRARDGQVIELRMATIPTVGGNEDVVMRILPTGGPLPMDKMGFSDRNLREFKEMMEKPYGIILVVGPTGSGKTTTLHAALGYINRPEKKIWTAEDPVEVSQYRLRQVQVLPKIGYTFAAAMRTFLRADPDVIMVGEMRDAETAAIGIEASLTGHLVLSTLHTNSAPETVIRLLDMGMDPYNFSDALLSILAQRLIRRLCVSCKEAYHPSRAELDELRRNYGENFSERIKVDFENLILYRAKACASCRNTGYKGRMGIHELLVGSDKIKRLVQRRATVEEIRDVAIEEGMTTLLQDGIEKVIEGHTDFNEVRSVCIK